MAKGGQGQGCIPWGLSTPLTSVRGREDGRCVGANGGEGGNSNMPSSPTGSVAGMFCVGDRIFQVSWAFICAQLPQKGGV